MHDDKGTSAGNKAIKTIAFLVLIVIFISFGRIVWSYIDGDTMTVETGGCHPDASTTGIMDAATQVWIQSGCDETAPVEPEPQQEPAADEPVEVDILNKLFDGNDESSEEN